MATNDAAPTSPAASENPGKTAEKTTAEAPAPSEKLIPQAHGGALKPGGTKGNRGGTGRPPDKLKEKWEALLNRPTTQRSLGMILKNPHHPHFPKVLVALSDRTRGRPGVQVRIPGQDGEGEILVDIGGIE
jgi:hypothetical protein